MVVQDGQQHVQMGKQIPEPGRRREAHAEIWAGAPLGKTLVQRAALNPYGIAKGFEQIPNEVRAFPRRHDRDPGFQGNGPFRQIRPVPAVAREGTAKHLGNRHAQVR